MAKDPAFLFYSSDFLTGTLTMNNEQVGKYIRLMCLQHQKGRLSEKDMLHICGSYDEDIFSKFKKDEAGNYFNARLDSESKKRKAFSESRSKNRKKHMSNISSSYDHHMENEIENKNETVLKKDKGGVGEIKKAAPGWQMVREFKKSFPHYHEEPEKDLSAVLSIIYKIADSLSLTKEESLNGSFEKVRLRWGEIVQVIATDNWYRKKNLSFIAHDWQQVMQLFNNGTHKQTSSKNGQPHVGKKSAGAARLAEELGDELGIKRE